MLSIGGIGVDASAASGTRLEVSSAIILGAIGMILVCSSVTTVLS